MTRTRDAHIPPVLIGSRPVGPGQPCFVVAEAGVNHNGDLRLAEQLVDAAVRAGADAVKFQTFDPDQLVTADADKPDYQARRTDASESQLDMLRRLELPREAFRRLKAVCDQCGIAMLSTPFDAGSVDFLDDLGVSAFKIAAPDAVHHPLLAHVGRKRRPVILSTGMCTLAEVEDAVEVLRNAGADDLILLHCVSNYPADPADVNLHAMRTLADAFSVPVGLSDHTLGTAVPLAAVALGACVVEKHLTLDRMLPGPDHHASLEPAGFKQMVDDIRAVESALGDGIKRPAASEDEMRRLARRSVVVTEDVAAGETIGEHMLAAKRPATGICPSRIGQVVGRIAARPLRAGTILQWADLTAPVPKLSSPATAAP